MSVDACANMVRTGDPDRFAAAMCAKDLTQRGDLMVLYALNIEVARAPWVTQEEMIAEMRLQWWKDAIDEIYDGETVRKHEVVTPLMDVISRAQLPRSLFDEMIEARRFDIYREGHASVQAFKDYIGRTSGNVMELAGRVLGAETTQPLQQFGYASGVANLMKALPELYARGRDPIPAPNIDRNACIEGRIEGDLLEAVRSISEGALSSAGHARSNRGSVPPSVTPAFLAGWQTDRVLSQVLDAPDKALSLEFAETPVRRAATLFWRNATNRW